MDNLKDWADSRETSIEVAEAIFHVCGDKQENAKIIWEDGCDNDEFIAIFERATNNGSLDPETLYWGEFTLSQLAKEFSH